MRNTARDDALLQGVGEGWQPLVRETHEKLVALDPDYTIDQVKEKFGGLRYYFSGSEDSPWDAMRIVVMEAERTSEVTCEDCGATGKGRSLGYWLVTLCDRCFETAAARRTARIERMTTEVHDGR